MAFAPRSLVSQDGTEHDVDRSESTQLALMATSTKPVAEHAGGQARDARVFTTITLSHWYAPPGAKEALSSSVTQEIATTNGQSPSSTSSARAAETTVQTPLPRGGAGTLTNAATIIAIVALFIALAAFGAVALILRAIKGREQSEEGSSPTMSSPRSGVPDNGSGSRTGRPRGSGLLRETAEQSTPFREWDEIHGHEGRTALMSRAQVPADTAPRTPVSASRELRARWLRRAARSPEYFDAEEGHARPSTAP